jgi:hypothetical protein
MTIRRALAGLLFVILPTAVPNGPAAPAPDPPSWLIRMSIDVRGDYRMEDRSTHWTGTYAFIFNWEGMIERDGEDFILIHNSCDLASRRFEERAFGKDTIGVLTADDVPDRPELSVKYVLRDNGRIRFNFAVTGFEVPLNNAPETFPLVLPASAENADRPGGFNYSLFVKSGSNDITLDEKTILAGPAEHAFSWTWAWQTRVLKEDTTLSQSNRHEVKVKLVFTPRKG